MGKTFLKERRIRESIKPEIIDVEDKYMLYKQIKLKKLSLKVHLNFINSGESDQELE